MTGASRWLFQNGPQGKHIETVEGFTDVATASPAAHETYQLVLDPDSPVVEQARRQIDLATPLRQDSGGRLSEFTLKRSAIR